MVATFLSDHPEEEEHSRTLHMRGQITTPEEVANVVYLVSGDDAGVINGSVVMADDGYCSFKL